jgi:ABC-type transport system involved in multi-copper enzyme maturation permease subunit
MTSARFREWLRRVDWHALAFWRNPMLTKELRARMRGWRSPITIAAYLLALGGIGCLFFLLQANQARYGGVGPQIGLQLFIVLTLFQLLLAAFITPGFTVGAISGEKERQTFDLLLCTRLTPAAIIIGKLFAGTGYSLLLLVAGLPILSCVFLFGGISLSNLLLTFLVLVVNVILFASVGIFWSSVFRRTQVSTIVAYATIFMLLFGLTLTASVLQNWRSSQGYYWDGPAIPSLLQYFSPMPALSSAIMGVYQGGGMGYLGIPLQLPAIYVPSLASFAGTKVTLSAFQKWLLTTPTWAVHVLIDLVLIVVLLTVSVQLVRPYGRFPTIRRLWARLTRRVPTRRKKEVTA